MKTLFLSILALTLLPIGVLGKLMYVPLNERISNSDLVIIGTLVDLVEWEDNSATYGTGTIVIDKVIAGHVLTTNGNIVSSGDRFPLEYVESFACVMGSHKRIADEKGIFLLTLGENNKIRYADFASFDTLNEIKLLLKKGVEPKETNRTIEKLRISTQLSPINNEGRPDSGLSVGENEVTRHPDRAVVMMLVSVFLFGFLYRNRLKSRFARIWPT